MKFPVDAQLPRRLARILCQAGHDAIHTLDLPAQNRTTDATVSEVADLEDRVVVSKDFDFVDSFLLKHEPCKLLYVSTGNITNIELENLVLPNLPAIVTAFQSHLFIELTALAIIIHE